MVHYATLTSSCYFPGRDNRVYVNAYSIFHLARVSTCQRRRHGHAGTRSRVS